VKESGKKMAKHAFLEFLDYSVHSIQIKMAKHAFLEILDYNVHSIQIYR
jgi:hypothetical protein